MEFHSSNNLSQVEAGMFLRRKWCCGVLNDKFSDDVPGSVLLLSKPSQSNQTDSDFVAIDDGKKRTKDGKIVLEPQPEDSSNDPLNWRAWRRTTALLVLGFYCMLGGGITPMLAAGFQDVAETYHIHVEKVALTTGFYMMGLGVGGVFVAPLGTIFGKRPIYLMSALVLIAASMWCALTQSYLSLVAARIVQGIAVSPVEVLASATVSELFFLHERAFRLGIYTLLLLSGKNLVPLISAVIIQAAGWRWVFWDLAVAVVFGLILLFLLLPESFWDRTTPPPSVELESFETKEGKGSVQMIEVIHESDMKKPEDHDDSITPKRDDVPAIQRAAASNAQAEGSKRAETSPSINQASQAQVVRLPTLSYTDHWRIAPTKSYLQSLAVFPGRLSNDNYFRIMLRPFVLYAYPAILWSALVYSLSVGWLVVLSECIGEIFRNRNSYDFTSLEAGMVYISPFVGAVIGTALAGKLSDFIVKFMAARNQFRPGMYEPEFRLVMAIPVALATTAGLMGFGWSVEVRDQWIVPVIFFGIISFGCSLGSSLAIGFAVDSYHQYASEALVTLNFSKNIFHGLAFSLFFPGWMEKKGTKQVFVIIGSIQMVCMLCTIPMFIYGKRARMWTVRKNMMRNLSSK